MIYGFYEPSATAEQFYELSREADRRISPAMAESDRETQVYIGASAVARIGSSIIGIDGAPIWQGEPVGLRDLLRLFMSKGPGFVRELRGNFSLAYFDSEVRSLTVAVDRIGIGRITYATTADRLVFGSKADQVAITPGVSREVADQSIYDYLFFHMVPSPRTIYADVLKLPLAHKMTWKPGDNTRAERYWSPDFSTPSAQSRDDLKEELRCTLESAVRRSMGPDKVGAFLSGGLDSSTVAGYLAKVRPDSADTFSIGFGVPEYDELQYARTTAQHFGCNSHELDVNADDIVDCFAKIAETCDEPFGNSSVIPTYCCAKLAKENGVDVLLAGDGGDELFGGNERYAKQKVFQVYYGVPKILRTNMIEPFSKLFSAETSFLPFRKLRSYVDQALIPLPHRLVSWNFAFREGLDSLLVDDFAASVDLSGPARHMADVYAGIDAEPVLNRLLAYDWRMTLADNDLRKVGMMCELADIKVAYPLLDDDVVEFSTRVPANLKMKGTALRSFYKYAMRGFLPNEVLSKQKHGFGLPFGIWLKSNERLREMIFSNLLDLKSRGMFQSSFIDELTDRHASGHASYFGYLIWDLAILEEWLKRHS